MTTIIGTCQAHAQLVDQIMEEEHRQLAIRMDHERAAQARSKPSVDTFGLMVAALQCSHGIMTGCREDYESVRVHIERALTAAGRPFQPIDVA